METGEEYWISGPKKDGTDKLYGGFVEIDEDAHVEYWTTVRGAQVVPTLPSIDRESHNGGRYLG